MSKQEVNYLWRVSLPGRDPVEVVAVDKLQATHRAAHELDVVWRKTARHMDVDRLRKAPAGADQHGTH